MTSGTAGREKCVTWVQSGRVTQSAGTAKAQCHVSVTQCIKLARKGVAKGTRGGRNFCLKQFQAMPWLSWIHSVYPVTNEQVIS